MSHPLDPRPRVGLFVTCLVDLIRPSVGFAAVKLIEQAGCRVEVPAAQTCCGQPAYNSGDRADARDLREADDRRLRGLRLRRRAVRLLRRHAEVALSDAARRRCGLGPPRAGFRRAQCTSWSRSWSTCGRWPRSTPRFDGRVTYHDSCSGLRELGVKQQPRELLRTVEGLELVEMADNEVCCGFGGTFCRQVSRHLQRHGREKGRNIAAAGRRLLLAGDLGCLMNMAGKLKREGRTIAVRHVAEVLAGELRRSADRRGRRAPRRRGERL